MERQIIPCLVWLRNLPLSIPRGAGPFQSSCVRVGRESRPVSRGPSPGPRVMIVERPSDRDDAEGPTMSVGDLLENEPGGKKAPQSRRPTFCAECVFYGGSSGP